MSPSYIEEASYPHPWLEILDRCTRWLMQRGSADKLFSCFIWTTEEMKTPWRKVFTVPVLIPVYFLLYVLLLPISSLSFLLWLTFQHKRKPYRYAKSTKGGNKPQPKQQYCFATTNICILPEFLSRFNNSSDNIGRARAIAKRIAKQQACASSILKTPNNPPKVTGPPDGNPISSPMIDHSVLEEFPELDVLVIQEAWLPHCCKDMIEELSGVFPHIVYDVGVNTWESNRFLGNSGLMIASKYPVMAVNFNWYKNKCFADHYSSKGLQQIKVDLGMTDSGVQLVGYIANTHLQAYHGNLPIHSQQMDDMVRWSREFRNATLQPHEKVLFDVIGGDFNTDNMSPVDEPEWNHKLFQQYEDICRERPGKDYSWAVGTEMRHRPLHDERISTPALLRSALEDPELLQYYVMDADVVNLVLELAFKMPDRDKDGNMILLPGVGGRRRIDYVIHRRCDDATVLACNPVSLLATLTDHIPYSLTIQVPSYKLM